MYFRKDFVIMNMRESLANKTAISKVFSKTLDNYEWLHFAHMQNIKTKKL